MYGFQGTADGSAPAGGVVADRAGNLYGTTYKFDGDNDGVAFELRKHAAWKDSVLYSFTNNGGGEDPYAGMIMPAKGTLYGTAIESGRTTAGLRLSSCQERSIRGPGRCCTRVAHPATATRHTAQ